MLILAGFSLAVVPLYLFSPQELAQWQERFILEDGVNLIGGCCGTTPAHIAAL